MKCPENSYYPVLTIFYLGTLANSWTRNPYGIQKEISK